MVHHPQHAADRNGQFSVDQLNQQQFMHPVLNYPLREILQPHAHDVLCGRGTSVGRFIQECLPLKHGLGCATVFSGNTVVALQSSLLLWL